MTGSNQQALLIVDDQVENLRVLSGLLKRHYRIQAATSGEEALKLVLVAPLPDLILLDVMMPDLDGYQVCERLKAEPQTRDIPIIFLTARTHPEDEARGFAAGAADYVAKPIHPPLLLARVRAQLALAEPLHKARRELDVSEFERRRLWDRQQALLAISRTALRELTLPQYLNEILDILAAIPWFAIERCGMLFLVNRRQEPILVAQRGMEDVQCCQCVRVRPGSGVGACGQVLVQRRALFCPSQRALEDRCSTRSDETGCYHLPLMEGEQVYGVLALRAPLGREPGADEMAFMADVAYTLASLIRRRLAEETLRVSQVETQMARNEAIRRLGVAAEFRDTETGFHVLRMSRYARVLAQALGCDETFCELLELAAPMHDVGKIGIDDAILKKPGKLTDDEFTIMKTHTTLGGLILEGGDDPLIRLAREIALTHHEKWNGQGYPQGLAGVAIPLSGRICAVADVFDALTMERPYKRPWPVEKAVALIEAGGGTDFDAEIVAAFRERLPELVAIKARYRDDVIDPREILLMTRSEADGDVWLPWRPEYSIGITVIDEHHRYLLGWINRIYDIINDNAGTAQIASALFALEQYARIHFQAEERLMAAHQSAGLERHRIEHRSFETELREWRAELAHNPFIAGMEMLDYLRTWLLNHILMEDKRILETLSHTTLIVPDAV
ncbi:bacteriohemerythrin [Thiobaca trueperi]|uniref:Hemerythrin-like metal-binding protein n=1 Tax=Thiobaca trueperi TaxID=127458 RepID=A0A4R3N3R1_9GAMM|nr:bacteriohemerythrin [Thiobaca trueperi]TCT22851.1 hemerythrin-like metal-binding protein [Thiobaca trueperi]